MPFPTSPTDEDVYVKDGVRYVYSSSSNSWTKSADPNKSAANIKNGVSIDGISGTFPNDGTATESDVISGKTFYSSNATKKTGTYSTNITWGDEESVSDGDDFEIRYKVSSDGKMILPLRIYTSTFFNISEQSVSSTATARRICSLLSKTYSNSITAAAVVSNDTYWYNGSTSKWESGTNSTYQLKIINCS